MTEITEAVDVEEALRLAEVGEYLYDEKAFSAGNGYDEPREFSICWDWQQSKPNEYGQGVLLAEAVAWHREMAADGIETQANKLRSELTRLQEEVKGLAGFATAALDCLWDGYAMDGSDIQDAALQHGLIVQTTFDPNIHSDRHGVGAEDGDKWFVPAPWLVALQGQQS